MIKSQELRIGNYVTGVYESEDDDIIVNINCKVIGVCENGTFDWPIMLEPIESNSLDITEYDKVIGIPLTEDILLKAGFEYRSVKVGVGLYKEHLYYIERKSFYINFDKKYGICALDSGSMPNPWFKYLHQLQNLYFALTGDELTVNF